MSWDAAALIWQVGNAAWSYLGVSRDLRIRRWCAVIKAHHLDPFTALVRLGVPNVSTTVGFDRKSLADQLTPGVLHATAETFNVRHDWLLGCDDRPYDLMILDRSFAPLVRELLTWQKRGSGHALLVFKSANAELDTTHYQKGVLVLAREMEGSGEPVYAYLPIGSLHSWVEPKQRWLALRMIWAAWHLRFVVHGYTANESQCDRLRSGNQFTGTLQKCWGVGSWYPDDYVVRPSVRAKGDTELIQTFHREYGEELCSAAGLNHRDVGSGRYGASKGNDSPEVFEKLNLG